MNSPIRSSLIAPFLLFTCAATFSQVPGFQVPGTEKKPVAATLVSEMTTIAPGRPFRVAVKLETGPGWHTYGKKISEGKTGKPTELAWTLPEGWKSKELPWPELKLHDTTEGPALSYEGIVYLPQLITPPSSLKPGDTVKITVEVDALVCKEVCIPARDLKPSIELKVGTEAVPDAKNADIFKDVPPDTPSQGSNSPGATDPLGGGSLPYYLLLAFLGGLILNIMPCVFPVLAIKITGVVQQAHEDRRQLLLHGLTYTLGVLVSLWTLASILLFLRAGGTQIGWGFQLQSPWFVYAVVLIMVVFGLNMAGLFEVGTSVIGAGGSLTAKSGLSGSFFSGLFATVVATPCTAPLLATALPIALALPAAGSLGFFTVIGLGLASPYLVLSLMPDLMKKLPRPGPWMESFKQGMSFLMLGAAGFFVWVLLGLISDENQRDLLVGLAIIAMAFWIYGRWCVISKPARTRVKGYIAAVIVLAAGIWFSHPRDKGLPWEKWSPQLVTQLLGDKKPVYVDFTARWCATCQVNHRVYDDKSLKAEIKKRGIVLLKADWTDYDPVISKALLDEFNEQAVPVNALYIPGRDKPVVLPKLLTVENVKAAFAELDK
jgi:thiol:disulfide interchange protein